MILTLLTIGCLGAKTAPPSPEKSQNQLEKSQDQPENIVEKAKTAVSQEVVTIQDNNGLYCVLGSDSNYYPEAGTPRDTGVWCKEEIASSSALFDQYREGNNIYFRSHENKNFCRSVKWKRRDWGDWRHRIECDVTDAAQAERFTLSHNMLTDSQSQYCFSDGITGIRCRWTSGTSFTISKYTPPSDTDQK